MTNAITTARIAAKHDPARVPRFIGAPAFMRAAFPSRAVILPRSRVAVTVAGSGHRLVRRVRRRAGQVPPTTVQVGVRVDDGQVGRLADLQGPALIGQPDDPGRVLAHHPATSRQLNRPGSTMVARATTDSAVCSPIMPGRALANSQHFSCSACGA